ncbi:MAG: hypothetical protein GX130_08585 [Candidatus Hydrogenedens sp.]|jgi:hypothetical protein|nr:hypothetical protein [Candidatus Hydrogenedens sp.]
MALKGILLYEKVGTKLKLRLKAGNHAQDFKVEEELSQALLDIYLKNPEELNRKEVQFEKGGKGAIRRVSEPGIPWEKPGRKRKPARQTTPHSSPTRQTSNLRIRQIRENKALLTDNRTFVKKDTVICEFDTAEEARVEIVNNKLRRTDYYSENPQCYPFNFVSAPRLKDRPYLQVPQVQQNKTAQAERILRFFNNYPHLDHGHFAAGTHSGIIELELTALSPLLVSHPPGRDAVLSREEIASLNNVYNDAVNKKIYGTIEKIKKKKGNTPKEEDDAKKERLLSRFRPSWQIAPGKYALPATSLKGMLRSYLEAYSLSLMGSLSASLKGDKDEGNARMHSRTNHRCAARGISPLNVTLYTYHWTGKGPAGNWKRWVTRGFTPWDKLSHVNPEENLRTLSLADCLFGRVFKEDSPQARNDSAIPALRGRVRISEASGWNEDGESTVRSADEYWFLKTLTRPSGAKAKCEALYLRPKNGKVDKYDNPNSEARGRKMYWSHSLGEPGRKGAQSLAWMRDKIAAAPSQDALWNDQTVQQAIRCFRDRVKGHRNSQPDTKSWVKPLLPGSRFRFSIRFENLTDIELGALLKAIELANKPGETPAHCHRLGRAKPLGFGSVLLTIKDIKLWDTTLAITKLYSGKDLWKIETIKEQQISAARKAFNYYCRSWKDTVWEEMGVLTSIPTGLTDMDYWKNWSDYQPWQNSDYPLPLPKDAKPW